MEGMSQQQRRALERALMDALMKSLRPAMERVVATFRDELAALLDGVDDEAPARPRGQLGRPKRCSVCRLEGARNDAALPADHTQEDHRRWKAGWRSSAERRRRQQNAA